MLPVPTRDGLPADPAVAILLCTFNGEKWLPAQLASIAAQTHTDWVLCVSDDGSTDGTLDMIHAFARDHPVWINTDRRRSTGVTNSQMAAENFLQTLSHPDLPIGPNSHVALCDQDDIWRPDKLAHALSVLSTVPISEPAVYGGQSRHIADDGRTIGASKPPQKPLGLRNAMLQNVVSGHSTVLSPAGVKSMRVAGVPQGIHYHDWWIYLFMSAIGARIVVDDHIALDYRQHGENVMGMGQGSAARLTRLGQIWSGEFGGWIRANLAALAKTNATLTPEAKSLLQQLENGLTAKTFRKASLYRQSQQETFCIFGAAALSRL
ncbi:MAG: glycosyltransferase [Octadecabacter sp.]